MARSTLLPAGDEKIGRKIDYLAAGHAAPALAGHGFRRKGRTLFRESGVGAHRCLAMLNLQGNPWNEGAAGRFCVNLGVQFPAVTLLMAEVPYLAWTADHAESKDEAACLLRARIDSTLPDAPEGWWPKGLRRGQDFWFEIDAGTDLPALGQTLARLLVEYAVPWLDTRSSLEGLLGPQDAGVDVARPLASIAAAILLGRQKDAEAAFDDPAQLTRTADHFDAVKAWASRHGLDVSGRAYAPPPAPPGIAARAASLKAKREALAAEAAAFLDNPQPIAARLDGFLDAFVAEGRSLRVGARQMDDRRLWSALQGESDDTCRALVLRALQRLVTAPAELESVEDNVWGPVAFVHDFHWGELIAALLARKLPPTEAFCRDLLARLRDLTDRVHERATAVAYPFPFVRLVKYLDREARPWRAALKPAVEHLLDAITASGQVFAADDSRAIDVLRQWAE
jgi:hypothetical protein